MKENRPRGRQSASKETTENGPLNLRQLSEMLHLSQTTISLVLNDSPAAKSIPQHTRERVFEAARKFQYRPNYFARSLRRNCSMSIGLIVPDVSDGYFTVLMHAVEEYLIRSHYFYFTASHYRKADLTREYSRLLLERAVDGFLMVDTPEEIQTSLPTVAISAHNPAPGVVNIILDHDKAAELALQHLYDLGHRRIAFMKGPVGITDAIYRWSGIEKAAASLGICVAPELSLQLLEMNQSPEMGYDPVRDLLAQRTDFTAIFCFNDVSAIGAIRAISDAGLRVPEDISIIGFDDIISAAYYKPSITTVKQPLREMGTTGAQVVLDLIQHPDKEYPGEIIMQPELIVRESTGPAPENLKSWSQPGRRRSVARV
ncbi:LacI family DNA-binding transcriptional regulator [Paracidobacterium acidisoli]|uniref:LacI family transcriptional regulator n=1 Tax=Paracidobacterium acidisoli TaxID=2303751 RepID=A0A372IRT3_9BACT|nr:LacI family DNA-binding transcriptional regulator [Paracidobacterium acidisoli]MBT9330554.1 LacI family transcriptional regulator [Paracidobacterium acidisoli]